MYDSSIIAARLDQATNQIGWRPVYHSVEEVELVNKRLDSIAVRDQSGKPTGETTRPYTESEKWWIRNERMLCACDALYWITRYAYFKNRENFIQRFKPEVAQQIYFNVIASLEKRRAAIQLIILKARQLGMCLDPNTRVLTADLRWIRIDDVKLGDELVAIDEGLTGEQFKASHAEYARRWKAGGPRVKKENRVPFRKMRTCKVEAKREVFEPAVRLVMSDGRQLIATAQHRFLVKNPGAIQPSWKKVSEIKIGGQIRYITTP